MLSVIDSAMNSSTSWGTWVVSRSAFLRRMARRVSRSGGWMSVISPHLNRVRSRSSRVAMWSGDAVGGEHDLAARLVQGVERVEELLLEALLALDELDVVDEQHVGRLAVLPAEGVAACGSGC